MKERFRASESKLGRNGLKTSVLLLAAAGIAACTSSSESPPTTSRQVVATETEVEAPVYNEKTSKYNREYDDFRAHPVVYCEEYPTDSASVFVGNTTAPISTILGVVAGEVTSDEHSKPGYSHFRNGWMVDYHSLKGIYDVHKLSGFTTDRGNFAPGELKAEFTLSHSVKTQLVKSSRWSLPEIELTIESVGSIPPDSSLNIYDLDNTKPGIIITVSCKDEINDQI